MHRNDKSFGQFSLLFFKNLIPVSFIFAVLALLGYLSTISVLNIELDSATNSTLQVFWAKEKMPFSQPKSTITPTEKGKQSYWFLINDFSKNTFFRIDPTIEENKIKIHSIKLYSLWYSPIKFNLINDALKLHQIEIDSDQLFAEDYIELTALGNDSQFQLQPIHTHNSFIILGLLVLIASLLFEKKNAKLSLGFLLAGLFLYYLLSFNETTVSFHVQDSRAGTIKIFWKDKAETYSNNRASKVSTEPDIQNYTVKTGNLANIDTLYLEKNSQLVDNITIKEPGFKVYTLSESKGSPSKKPESTELLISGAAFLIFFCFVAWAVVSLLNKKQPIYFQFYPKLIALLFLISSMQIFTLAWQANANLHPDEIAHIESVKYYSEYWAAPKIGDSRAKLAYQAPWAISRLDDLGISYFFAGKFRNIIQAFFSHDTFSVRAFNALLFLLLFIVNPNKRRLLFFAPLLCSPQIWYLYSYANRGAFVLFISLLLAWQLANQKSGFNKYFNEQHSLFDCKKIIYPGLLLGILSFEQTNYVLFILFVFSVLIWQLLFCVKQKKLFIYKLISFMMMGASVFLIRYSFDVSLNGFDKKAQRIAYAEANAGPGFKPSIAETKNSYSGLRLKAKGVTFTELFQSKWDWHKQTFKSFTGFYGYYAEYSPKWYYFYVLLIYFIVFVVLLWHATFNENWRYNLFSLLSITAVSGGLLIGLLFSWLHDFQPQGRYIFPIIPIILVYFWILFPRFNQQEKSILISCALVLTLLSFYSFNEVALNYLVSY